MRWLRAPTYNDHTYGLISHAHELCESSSYYEQVDDDDALCPSTETPLLLRVCIVIVSCDVPPSHILLMSYTLTTFLNKTKIYIITFNSPEMRWTMGHDSARRTTPSGTDRRSEG